MCANRMALWFNFRANPTVWTRDFMAIAALTLTTLRTFTVQKMLTCNLDDAKLESVNRDGPRRRLSVRLLNFKASRTAPRRQEKPSSFRRISRFTGSGPIKERRDRSPITHATPSKRRAVGAPAGAWHIEIFLRGPIAGNQRLTRREPSVIPMQSLPHELLPGTSLGVRRKCSLVVDHRRLRIVLTAHNVG